MNRKRLQPYLDVFAAMGVDVDDISITGSNHVKLHVRKGEARRFFIAPFSPSDHCGISNFRRDVRIWLRNLEQADA